MGGDPGAERAAVILASVGKQRGVKANPVAVRSGMKGDINGGVRSVGEKGALIQREVGVGIAQDKRGDSTILQFLAQAAGEGDGDVLLGERRAEGFAAVIAAMAGVDDGEVTARNGSRSRRGRLGCRVVL